MEQLVRFRLLLSTLSLDEYRNAISNVLDDTNREEFSCMIFNHLKHKMRNENVKQSSNGLQIDTINQEISDIISQRKPHQTPTDVQDDETDTNTESHEPLNLTHFTNVIIQQIASYLPFKSYSLFQCCCRSIFYAANSPSTLYEFLPTLVMRKIKEYFIAENLNQIQMQLFMKRFERVQKLTIYSWDSVFDYIKLIKLTNLKSLVYFPFKKESEEYLALDTFNWNTITHLDIAGSYTIEIIKRCTNLRTLVVNNSSLVFKPTNEFSQQLAELESVRNLHGLYLGTSNIDVRVVLKDICNTLLQLKLCHRQLDDVKGMTFTNLVDLALVNPSPTNIISIIKNTKHLKRLRLQALLDESEIEPEPSYKLAFEKTFELNALEHCHIQCTEETNIMDLTHWIESSFHRKRDRLKLNINVACAVSPTDIYEAIVRIWTALSTWHTSHFMLVLSSEQQSAEEAMPLNQWLDGISNTFFVYTFRPSYYPAFQYVVIANKWSAFRID
eukprot:257648_1